VDKRIRPWTAGQLRQALEGVPDDTVIVVNTDDPRYPDMVEEHTIYEAGYGRVDWGDGHGMERDQAFGLNCHFADEFRVKPDRQPLPQPQAEQLAEAEAEAEIQ
jgi:hypothetical protein